MCLVVIVEAVGTKHLNDGLSLHLRFGDISEVDASRVALELDVEAELVALYRRSQIIYVLHHEAPVGLLRIVARVLERLHEQCLRSVGIVGGKLAHLIGHAAVCVLIGNGKHLVGLQLCLERYVSESRIYGIFRRIEQSCLLQFLIVGSAFKSWYGVERSRCLVDVACGSILIHHTLILGIGCIRRHGLSSHSPRRIGYTGVLAEVGKGYDVAGVGCSGGLVGCPHFYAVNLYARRDVGQRAHPVVILVVEELRKEEVAVFLIVSRSYLKRRELLASLG